MRQEMSLHILVRGDVTYFRVTCYSFTKSEMVFEELVAWGVAENNKVRNLEVFWVRSENHSECRPLETFDVIFKTTTKYSSIRFRSGTRRSSVAPLATARWPVAINCVILPFPLFSLDTPSDISVHITSSNISLRLILIFLYPLLLSVTTGLSYRGFHHK